MHSFAILAFTLAVALRASAMPISRTRARNPPFIQTSIFTPGAEDDFDNNFKSSEAQILPRIASSPSGSLSVGLYQPGFEDVFKARDEPSGLGSIVLPRGEESGRIGTQEQRKTFAESASNGAAGAAISIGSYKDGFTDTFKPRDELRLVERSETPERKQVLGDEGTISGSLNMGTLLPGFSETFKAREEPVEV